MIREQMYAALGAANEAILRTGAQDELFQRVCDAAVETGGIRSAFALVPQSDSWLRIVAGASHGVRKSYPDMQISTDQYSERGQGLAGTAFRSKQACISNDFENDSRSLPWRSTGLGVGIRAGAAFPVLRGGRSVAVFLFFVNESGAFDDTVVAILQRMIENVSYALGGFERDLRRTVAERANRRLTDMFAALSATNTAILQSRNAEEMFRTVCESVAKGGRSLGAAAIFLAESDTHWLKLAAASGAGLETISKLQLSIDPHHERGDGLAGPAFREQTLKICYDLTSDPLMKSWVEPNREPHGGAAVPLVVDGASVGVLYFFFGRRTGHRDDELAHLMRDIGKNVSFGLELFAREQQKERLTCMFAALSATNEAIMRAVSREELYQFVCEGICEAAKFTSAAIALLDETGDYLTVHGVSGPTADRMRKLVLATSADHPAGKGLSGSAFRTGQPAVSNDWVNDQRSDFYRQSENQTRAVAAIPIISDGAPLGVMLFVSREKGIFAPDFVEVLSRIGRNVAFSLAAFDKADEKVRAEQRIQYMATHDGLTGLPNRAMFAELLDQAIASAQRHKSKCAVLFLDLDRFKVINDTLGHTAGDCLLIEVARRIRASVRASDVVARLGGDEFVVILNDVSESAQVETAARKILSGLVATMNLAGHECRTTGSIGIALFPDNGLEGHVLTKNADAAMYIAKEEGKNDLRFYSPEIKSQSIERLMLETSLRNALELQQFSLHYQPKISVANGAVSGVEALLRWAHPNLGDLAPMKFIPLAEETGLIIPIGRWVLKTACEQAVNWQTQGLPAIAMAVNLSPRQFQHEHLLRDIDDCLAQTGLAPSLLQLEITESMVMQNIGRAIKVLEALRARGVRLAIDDFGTGYSSMSMMKQFPIDTIKIDRSFVRDLASDKEDQAITTAIIDMGKALGLTVVAEGVESAEQDAFLRQRACDELQGFLFSKPVPPEQIPSLLVIATTSPSLQPAEDWAGRLAGV